MFDVVRSAIECVDFIVAVVAQVYVMYHREGEIYITYVVTLRQ